MKYALASAVSPQTQRKVGDCVANRYTIVELPLRPTQLNNLGQVAGTPATHKAALCGGTARGINDQGQIVGDCRRYL
jgi:hypothetical protein